MQFLRRILLFPRPRNLGQNLDFEIDQKLNITDYLDEEYVDLDWTESTESTMNSEAASEKSTVRPPIAMAVRRTAEAEEGSGIGQEIDDEDEQEGSSKNEAHLIYDNDDLGSGDFGKKLRVKARTEIETLADIFAKYSLARKMRDIRNNCTSKFPNFLTFSRKKIIYI